MRRAHVIADRQRTGQRRGSRDGTRPPRRPRGLASGKMPDVDTRDVLNREPDPGRTYTRASVHDSVAQHEQMDGHGKLACVIPNNGQTDRSGERGAAHVHVRFLPFPASSWKASLQGTGAHAFIGTTRVANATPGLVRGRKLAGRYALKLFPIVQHVDDAIQLHL